jgi:hypothetical protein
MNLLDRLEDRFAHIEAEYAVLIVIGAVAGLIGLLAVASAIIF